jgi:hypothetical protein
VVGFWCSAPARCRASWNADVAADALADVLLAALVDLLRQKGIGDQAPRPDQIEHAAPDLPDLLSGR